MRTSCPPNAANDDDDDDGDDGDDDDDGYPPHCDDHHDCMVEWATRGENDRPLNAANVHIDDDDDIWQ